MGPISRPSGRPARRPVVGWPDAVDHLPPSARPRRRAGRAPSRPGAGRRAARPSPAGEEPAAEPDDLGRRDAGRARLRRRAARHPRCGSPASGAWRASRTTLGGRAGRPGDRHDPQRRGRLHGARPRRCRCSPPPPPPTTGLNAGNDRIAASVERGRDDHRPRRGPGATRLLDDRPHPARRRAAARGPRRTVSHLGARRRWPDDHARSPGCSRRLRPYSGVAMATLPRPAAAPRRRAPCTDAGLGAPPRPRPGRRPPLHLLDPAVIAGNAVESAWLAAHVDDLAGRPARGARRARRAGLPARAPAPRAARPARLERRGGRHADPAGARHRQQPLDLHPAAPRA